MQMKSLSQPSAHTANLRKENLLRLCCFVIGKCAGISTVHNIVRTQLQTLRLKLLQHTGLVCLP